MADWQPIETAPKDGTSALLCFGGGVFYVGRWLDGSLGEPQRDETAWRCDCCGRFASPTHWQPLPHRPSPPDTGE